MLTAPAIGRASVYVVDPDGTGDFPTIQDAIIAATDTDVIELTDGVFAEDGNRDVDFLGKSISVRSQSLNPEACIIDCEGTQAEPHRGFLFQSSEGPASRLEGVAIVNGYAENGGALFFDSGTSPTIERCVLTGNAAVRGGAVYRFYAAPRFTSTTITANIADFGGGIYSRGGGVGPQLDRCITWGSCADAGPDVFLHNGSVTFECCVVDFDQIDGKGFWFGDQFVMEDPLFCNPESCEDAPTPMGDYTVRPNSPCLPESSPCGQLIGALGEGCGFPTRIMTTTWGRIKVQHHD